MPKNKTMRITGGKLVRRLFLLPSAVDRGSVRPTPDRVREAVFSMLFDELSGALVLDLFSGSGAHGFEALSRGACHVRFIEKDKNVANLIKENIRALDLEAVCSVEIIDAQVYILSAEKEHADIIFVDPPYGLKLPRDFFVKLLSHLSENGVVVYRCFKKDMPPIDGIFRIDRDRVYGGTRVFILRPLIDN